jgi:glycosyltransferase involved in cell wall biosynthesis
MKLSLITVTRNSGQYLEDSIKSVVGQTYKDIEFIIIDGKSNDNTIDIIKKYENYIHHWISEPDRGMYDAINKGMQLSTGDIIGILNSDDIFDNNDVVAAIVKTFVEQQVDSIYGDLEYVEQHDVKKVYRIWKGRPYIRRRFLLGWMPAHPTFYFKRKLYEAYGGYENHYYSAADYELMCRYLYKFKSSSFYLPKFIVRMRRGGQSNGSLKMRLRANRRDYLAMKKNNIPFAFIVSILKPLSKLHQYYKVSRTN